MLTGGAYDPNPFDTTPSNFEFLFNFIKNIRTVVPYHFLAWQKNGRQVRATMLETNPNPSETAIYGAIFNQNPGQLQVLFPWNNLNTDAKCADLNVFRDPGITAGRATFQSSTGEDSEEYNPAKIKARNLDKGEAIKYYPCGFTHGDRTQYLGLSIPTGGWLYHIKTSKDGPTPNTIVRRPD